MAQTTALARPYYSITTEGVARMEELRGLFKRNWATGVYGSAPTRGDLAGCGGEGVCAQQGSCLTISR